MRLDRMAPMVFGLLMVTLVVGFLAYGAHEFMQMLETLPLPDRSPTR